MENAVLKQDRERIIQREVFSNKYATLSSILGSNVATSFALLKMSFYDVKSQEEVLLCKGFELKQNTKRKRYSEYLDYITADELRYLIKGLDEILTMVTKDTNGFSGFPFIYNDVIELGKRLRYDFMEQNNMLPEEAPVASTSVKKVKKSLGQTKMSSFSVRPKKAVEAEKSEESERVALKGKVVKVSATRGDKAMNGPVLKQDRERIIQREVFANKYATLSSILGSNVATSFALLKMSFYDVKSQEALLECKGLEVKDGGKRKRYNEYLDYITADELRYLNKGLDEILLKVTKETKDFSGFPFIYNDIIELGKTLRYDYYESKGFLPEEAPVASTSVKKVKKCLSQTKMADFHTAPSNEQKKVGVQIRVPRTKNVQENDQENDNEM